MIKRAAALIVVQLISILMWGGAHAAELLSTEELRELQLKMKNATQLTVDFTQTTTVAIRPGRQAQSSGKAFFSKPTKFRWELAKPAPLLLFDGLALYDVNETTKIATKYPASGKKTLDIQEVIDLVLDFDSLLKRYKIMETFKEGRTIRMKLQPKAPGALLGIEVTVEAASASIAKIVLTFANKNVNSLEFSNSDRRTLPKSTFEVPKGYKIIEGV